MNAKSIYLTIDLDVWSGSKVDVEMLNRILSETPKNGRAAALHHDSVLPHISRYARFDKNLVNLDMHSDLGGCLDTLFEDGRTGLRRLELHTGSWVDYAELNEKKEYTWASIGPGIRTDHFSGERPFSRIQQVGRNPWRKLKHVIVKPPHYGLSQMEISAVSIVLSPDCCGDDAFEVFVDLVQRHELELLDCLPQDLNAVRLRPVNESLKSPERTRGFDDLSQSGPDWPVPRGLLRNFGFCCKTIRDRRKATRTFSIMGNSMWREEPKAPKLP